MPTALLHAVHIDHLTPAGGQHEVVLEHPVLPSALQQLALDQQHRDLAWVDHDQFLDLGLAVHLHHDPQGKPGDRAQPATSVDVNAGQRHVVEDKHGLLPFP